MDLIMFLPGVAGPSLPGAAGPGPRVQGPADGEDVGASVCKHGARVPGVPPLSQSLRGSLASHKSGSLETWRVIIWYWRNIFLYW